MPDYVITRISEKAPTEWNNPKGGVVYYRDVMLDGWEKPVSVGKKSPDALQVGMTISGTIERTGGASDKWHGAPMGSFGGGGGTAQAGSVAQAKYAPKDDHTQESIARSVALKAAVDWTHTQSSDHSTERAGAVLKIADQFLEWLQGGSTGGVAHPAPVTTQAAENPQSATTSSGYDKFQQAKAKLVDKREDEAIHETLMEQQGYEDLPADW